MAAFQLIDQACSAGDTLASVALVTAVQKPSCSILDEEYAPPRLVESVVGALRSHRGVARRGIKTGDGARRP